MTPDIAASVKARLLTGARERGEEFERTLTRFAAERLLYRLGASAAREQVLLKGAAMLSVWLPEPYRATRDVDVLAFGASDEAAIRALLEQICAASCPQDGLRFDLSELRIDEMKADELYPRLRARFIAYLGSARITVQVDFGFGDAVTPEPEEIDFPTMLPDLPAARVRAYPREVSVAEKFNAMVTLDTRNSRMKDFHDIWALSAQLPFDGQRTRQAIAATFERRGTAWTAEVPRALTPAFYQLPELAERWSGYLARETLLAQPPAQFEIIGEDVIAFLGPIRRSIITGDSFTHSWPPGGPWR